MEEKEIKRSEFRCSSCGSKQIYTLKNGVRVCRVCGFRSEVKDVTKN